MSTAHLSIILFFLSGIPAFSHEFWLEPEKYQVESGAVLTAHLRNGENFKGSSLAWFDKRFTRFEMISDGQVFPVTGRMGDMPALQAQAPGNGLLVVVHETTSSLLTYDNWDKFLKFVEHKDFSDAVAFHEANGWSKEEFRESYTRHVKALVAVGDGAGSDGAFGLETEFIALTNPFDKRFDGQMQVQVNYQGQPRPDAQVEVFARDPDGAVEVTLHRTDAKGQVTIPVISGWEYLFDAVVLRPSPLAGSSDRAPVWETLWAALTFRVPAQ